MNDIKGLLGGSKEICDGPRWDQKSFLAFVEPLHSECNWSLNMQVNIKSSFHFPGLFDISNNNLTVFGHWKRKE